MFLNREHLTLVHGYPIDKWERRFGIDRFTAPCYKCDAPCETTIPFVYDELRGLIAPVCACGHPNPPYCIVRVGGDILDHGFLERMFHRMKLREKRLKRPVQKARKPRKSRQSVQ